MVPWLSGPGTAFPDTRLALHASSQAPGLLAAGGELSPARLTQAYSRGIFPWYNEGQPVLWWSPDPRMVLWIHDFKVSRSLRKTLAHFRRSQHCEVRVDSAFREVMEHCARTPRAGQDGTWIQPEMIDAYVSWHALGRAHSVETWVDSELVGGLYGVGLGRMFFGESMFSHRTDASKVALAALVALCRAHHVPLIDCQQRTPHLGSLGATTLERADFEDHLAAHVNEPDVGDWSYHPALWSHILDAAALPPSSSPSVLAMPSVPRRP